MKNVSAKILTSFPVDSMAAKVAGNGYEFSPNKIVLTNDSEFPLRIRLATKSEKGQKTFIDLTGKKFGRFTVLGQARDFQKNWVVRCSCGKYTTRTSKAIKNPANNVDSCEHCRHLAHLKNEIHYRVSGKDLDCRGMA